MIGAVIIIVLFVAAGAWTLRGVWAPDEPVRHARRRR